MTAGETGFHMKLGIFWSSNWNEANKKRYQSNLEILELPFQLPEWNCANNEVANNLQTVPISKNVDKEASASYFLSVQKVWLEVIGAFLPV